MEKIDYKKIGKATILTGRDKKIYRALEIIPGVLSWATLLILVIFSFAKPVWTAYFIIAFDVYWLLLVIYLGILLISAYCEMQKNIKINWKKKCESREGWKEIRHLIILPTYNEDISIARDCFRSLIKDGYPTKNMIVVFAIEERAGKAAGERARIISNEFSDKFGNFLVTIHPDNIEGELKGKGANQTWAAREVKRKIIDPKKIDYDKIMVSVFDIDTAVMPGYFHLLSYKFLTVESPHRASYQPIPVYHNNVWQAPFFARVAASSNTFWQMIQQIRVEKLATYSSHSMTWKALIDIDFWSTDMVSEDSRIFWHCYIHYKGDYRVEPLHYPVSMDVTMDESFLTTAKNLYKQQRRWGWGVENVPYLIFNFIKRPKDFPKFDYLGKIFIQIYGFHSWATNALIIGVIGWLPIFIGGEEFKSMVLSSNLPFVARSLMTLAMIGLVLSTIISTLILPKRPKEYGIFKSLSMILQWIILPISIIFFGAIPALEAQTRLMFGKYLGFWVTPKKR